MEIVVILLSLVVTGCTYIIWNLNNKVVSYEEQIEECQRAMMGNDKLRERVNATLSDAHVAFLVARGKRIRDERKAYEEKRRADIIESRHIIEQKYGRKH